MRELHSYDYVNQPYAAVRSAIVAAPDELFRRATSDGSISKLHVQIGVVDLGAEIVIEVGEIDETLEPRPKTTLALTWHSKRGETLFPTMKATLSIYALTPTETQIELTGTYAPPLSLVGEALDAVAMHRIAESSCTSFVREIAIYLRRTMAVQQVVSA